MKELIPQLRQAAKAYYQESREIMSNFEYDKLYDELVSLEKETGIVFANSPTQNVGYEVVSAHHVQMTDKTHRSLFLKFNSYFHDRSFLMPVLRNRLRRRTYGHHIPNSASGSSALPFPPVRSPTRVSGNPSSHPRR